MALHERTRLVKNYLSANKESPVTNAYAEALLEIAESIHDDELDQYTLGQLLVGLFDSRIEPISTHIEDTGQEAAIAICALNNSAQLVKPYIEHYKSIGVQQFVFIDNGSTDNTVATIRDASQDDTEIDIWSTDDRFDGFKAMGWKQRMFLHYGLDKWYLNLDIDEHFVYPNSEVVDISSFANRATQLGQQTVGAMLVDMYPDADVTRIYFDETSKLREIYSYFDRDTYTLIPNSKYNHRIFGGPRTRVFGRHPSLQKYPLTFVSSDTIGINPHFWYPYSINQRAGLSSALLHYKFLPGDIDKYRDYVQRGVHWDNSSQYRSYVDGVDRMGGVNFYHHAHSHRYDNSGDLAAIATEQGVPLITDIIE
ncbi:MAG: glycosyltransferase family 2 protein [Candidatus Saccharimonas sp.]